MVPTIDLYIVPYVYGPYHAYNLAVFNAVLAQVYINRL